MKIIFIFFFATLFVNILGAPSETAGKLKLAFVYIYAEVEIPGASESITVSSDVDVFNFALSLK